MVMIMVVDCVVYNEALPRLRLHCALCFRVLKLLELSSCHRQWWWVNFKSRVSMLDMLVSLDAAMGITRGIT